MAGVLFLWVFWFWVFWDIPANSTIVNSSEEFFKLSCKQNRDHIHKIRHVDLINFNWKFKLCIFRSSLTSLQIQHIRSCKFSKGYTFLGDKIFNFYAAWNIIQFIIAHHRYLFHCTGGELRNYFLSLLRSVQKKEIACLFWISTRIIRPNNIICTRYLFLSFHAS